VFWVFPPIFYNIFQGAPEWVIERCTKLRVGSSIFNLDSHWKRKLSNSSEELAERGERVIGFCHCSLPPEQFPTDYRFSDDDLSFLDTGLVFAGFISMLDPPRPGVAESVSKCRSAGIKVVMVTGDHPLTAKAIARQVGIISEGGLIFN